MNVQVSSVKVFGKRGWEMRLIRKTGAGLSRQLHRRCGYLDLRDWETEVQRGQERCALRPVTQ